MDREEEFKDKVKYKDNLEVEKLRTPLHGPLIVPFDPVPPNFDRIRGKGGNLKTMTRKETVDHPPHYTEHPSEVECIQITEHMNFCLGNAIKYIWRSPYKNNQIEDLEKAIWYLRREINRLKKLNGEG